MSNINYQQAKRIRNTKFTDLLTDQLLYEKGIGSAIKKTASLKFQAKVKGFKEKFDPLNIAKFLTFGSKLGPAILGNITKRDRKDIEYFTGRLKPIRVGDNRAEKLQKLSGESDTGMGSGVNEVLMKMYGFMQKTHEETLRRNEIAQDFEEENKSEAERKHRELLTAIQNFTGKKVKKGTADKVTEADSSSFDFMSIFSDLLGIKNLGQKAVTAIRALGAFMISPIGIALLGGAMTVGALYWLVNYAAKNMTNYAAITPEQAAEVLARNDPKEMEKYGGEEGLKKIIEEVPGEAKDLLEKYNDKTLTKDERDLVEQKIKQLGGIKQVESIVARGAVQVPTKGSNQVEYAEKWGGGPRPTKELFPNLPENTLKLKQEKWDKDTAGRYNDDGTLKNEFKTPKQLNPTEPPAAVAPPATPANGTQPTASQMPSTPATPAAKTTNTSSAAPAAQPNTGSTAQAKTSENLQAVLNNNTNLSSPTTTQTINKNIVSKPPEQSLDSLASIAVRNQENTFVSMIVNSTRVV
jgi:hypothetical protein